jgi:beta-glucosidase
MRLQFPKHFFWGTSTAAAQIETASEHNWKGVKAQDGEIFARTSDHELRREEDIGHIARFGTVYRCGVDWARLQSAPFAEFDIEVVREYADFFAGLNQRGVKIMFVFHHFTHPIWFEKKESWLVEDNIKYFIDYVKKCIHHFGNFVSHWNTFNEPNVMAFSGYIDGVFPPFTRNIFKAQKVMRNMSAAHNTVFTMLKVYDKTKLVGISLNTIHFTGRNFLGSIAARIMRKIYLKYPASKFEQCDFWGLSYYAEIPLSPFPISEVHSPGSCAKYGYEHDDMWVYQPKGFGEIIRFFHKKYKKPIIVTENGACTANDAHRMRSIREYLKVLHDCIKEGIEIQGYIHWSTFDNFEWHLGLAKKFGLLRLDPKTKDRINTPSANFYEEICKNNEVEV